MKKIVIAIQAALLIAFSSPGLALEGQGTIREIRVCTQSSSARKSVFLYQLSDGNWFGAYGHYSGSSGANAYSGDGPVLSTVLMAYSTDQVVRVRATYITSTHCGISAAMQWDANGDYVILNKDDQ